MDFDSVDVSFSHWKANYLSVSLHILVVVAVVRRDINNIGKITVKIKSTIMKHEINNSKIDDIDWKHDNVVHKDPDLEHIHNMYNDLLTFSFVELLIGVSEH